ncbi:GNAT family N-acetyltransferase [Sphingomonas sp. LB-2]|uniref:GNAT family N-acetyltransferase n=1 Tax=Sphingomonas caeni TaxID=2984949 RepID=UPI00222F2C16|nr:GNAT family N-acetyltransferase [Sphingomonas caeni]MCW3847691.1 GNAT family N-acetyltransferase [Sphingomonas caeni]
MIETERLILRVPEPRDRLALHAIFADAQVMADLAPVKDAAGSDATLAKHDAYRGEGLGFWVVERREDGAVVGFCGLKRGDAHNPIAGEIEAGWIIDKPYWRQGYAFEAMEAALAWAWANLDVARIVAITAAVNVKSQRLMERLGMTRLADGDYEHPLFPEGDRLRSTVTYAIARPA